MFDIEFYKTEAGAEPVREVIDDLNKKAATSKDARIRRNKIVAYIDLLAEHGTWIGEPVAKHLDAEIWELRPVNDRILFFFVKENRFILLHHFIKKTQKTPLQEIEQAKRNMRDYLERNS
jgi:phage-related protein